RGHHTNATNHAGALPLGGMRLAR
ncbi:MAG: hypothetical protein QOD83_3401, partial [Solirubrobacteraceae bacterium]|nr:hypothetical protein [Solirubrobacteraceae bacterium]